MTITRLSWFFYATRHNLSRKKEKIQMAIAWKLPRWLVKWAVVRAFTHASTGIFSKQDPSMLTHSEVMSRWNMKDNNPKGVENGQK